MVKETLCLEASTDPLPKLGLGPLSACLTVGVVGVWKPCKPTAVAQYRDERSWPWKVQRQFPPLSTPTSFSSSLPARQPLPPLPNFLYSFSMLPLFLIFNTSPYLKCICSFILFYFIPILCWCLACCRSAPVQLAQQHWRLRISQDRPFPSLHIMYVGSVPCKYKWYDVRENHAERLWLLHVSGPADSLDPDQKQKEKIILSPNSVTMDKA